jgi:chromate transporter
MTLRRLAAVFLKIGATGFGGPMALIGLMQENLVEKTGEVKPEDFADGVAVGQMLPGPQAVNCATYLGYRQRGVLGAVVSAGALLAPPLLLMLILTPLYFQYGAKPEAAGFFKGVGPAVVAVILAAAWRMAGKFVPDWRTRAVALVALTAALLKVNPIIIVLVAGLLGVLARGAGEGPKAPKPADPEKPQDADPAPQRAGEAQ